MIERDCYRLNELIDYMLKNNVKLEQEIIGENENERKDINTY